MVLLAKYSLNGNANDLVGSNNGTATNVTWVGGKMNQGGSFNGSSSSIRATGLSLPAGNSPYHISGLLKLNSEITSGVKTIFNFNPDATSQDTIYVLDYEYNGGTRRLNYQHYYNGPETYYTIPYNITLGTSTYNHLAINYTGSVMQLYVNGVLVASGGGSGTYGTTGGPTFTKGFTMGATYANPTFSSFLNSILDEVEVHNTSLSVAEAKNRHLYFNGFF